MLARRGLTRAFNDQHGRNGRELNRSIAFFGNGLIASEEENQEVAIIRSLEKLELGRRIFGAAAIALGVLGFYYRDFATIWQPVPSEMPGYKAAALLTAFLFLPAGVALQWRPASRYGAAITGILYAIFTALWLRRVIGYPQIFATWGGTAEELALLAASAAIFVRSSSLREETRAEAPASVRKNFGLCAIAFGLNHFFNMTMTASMVPGWIPPGQWYWALATGLGHLLAGLAIFTGYLARPASRLLTLMFIIFGLLIWFPKMMTDPSLPITWTGNAVNLALIGAAWVVAEIVDVLIIARDQASSEDREEGEAFVSVADRTQGGRGPAVPQP